MAYPELDWRVFLRPNSNSRYSLSTTTANLSTRLSISIQSVPRVREVCKFQYIGRLNVYLSCPEKLEMILLQNGITTEQLTLLDEQPELSSTRPFLPLEWFDDFEYEPMSTERWLSIDNLQAFALVRKDNGSDSGWGWISVVVVDYISEHFLWTVMNNGDSWNVPRWRLYFVYENPFNFCERLNTALQQRSLRENHLKYSYLLQSMNVGDYFDLSDSVKSRLAKRTNAEVIETFQALYCKFHTGLSLNKCLMEYPKLNINPVHIMTVDKITSSSIDDCRKLYSYRDVFALNKRICLLSHPAVYDALKMVNEECEVLQQKSLYSLNMKEPITLTDFETENKAQLKITLRYLQNNWIEQTTMQAHTNLLLAGRGWFDVSVDDWTIYQFMKLFRLVEQIKQRMQTALRDLVLTSTDRFYHCICDSSRLCLLVEENFRWTENLIESPFESGEQPVFYLLLQMGDEAPFYSTEPDEFEATMKSLFNEAIIRSHDVHLIDPTLFGSLIFATDLYLSSVGLQDPVIEKRRNHIILCCQKTIIPLKAYAHRYIEFKELFFTNITEYVENIKLTKTSLQVKEEISFQIRMRESLEKTLPLSIVIGPFWVNVRPLREALIQMRKDLTAAILQMLTKRLRDKTSDIVADYTEIIDRMCDKPVSIEHICEIREFMESIPDLLQALEERMKTVVFEYEILDYFRCALPDADFYQKWHALAFPQSILKQMDSVYEVQDSEVDKYRKQQVSDEAGFGSQVEEINVYVSKFTTVYDVSKVAEVSVEVKKLWKNIKELLQYGETLNKRQELFEMPSIDLSSLLELKENFVAYKNLWSYAAEYINAEESWRENPLSSVEGETVNRTLQQYQHSFEGLFDCFEDQPQIQDVVQMFLTRVESFIPNLTIIDLLQHPLLEPIHWAQFAKVAGIKVKVSLATNLIFFLEYNISDHLDALRSIIVEAEQQKEETERIRAEEEEIMRQREQYERNRMQRRLNRPEI
ncbi:dynein axonemal heavy chain 1 [Wyeomyia smithii]|uniref:dynein axonemal heavy chain 1 n=1 Tax=Wyeomyia smithii TaxID=174621 RepID=UPI0024681EC3|nr:dynein axonemal heavy chain 1 [Wyeomyia smithii]